MNHRDCFRLYGIRRPLKWRRWMARQDRRLAQHLARFHRQISDDHRRWWRDGQVDLEWEAYKLKHNISAEAVAQMLEDMPF